MVFMQLLFILFSTVSADELRITDTRELTGNRYLVEMRSKISENQLLCKSGDQIVTGGCSQIGYFILEDSQIVIRGEQEGWKCAFKDNHSKYPFRNQSFTTKIICQSPSS